MSAQLPMAHGDLDPTRLVELALMRDEGHLTDTGALSATTGRKFNAREGVVSAGPRL